MQQVASHVRRNIVGYLALFFALTGTSYAATTTLLPHNSVGTKQVIDHSLLKVDFKGGQLPQGAAGPQGAQGQRAMPGRKVRKARRGRRGRKATKESRAFPGPHAPTA